MLYPQDNPTRETKTLDGLWRFAVDDGTGLDSEWFARPLANTMSMPVPASYNDLTEDPATRNHVGYVWYEREFFVPSGWADRRVVLRFASVTHVAVVWLNGIEVVRHRGGFTPFEVEVTDSILRGEANRLTVAVNNEIGFDTVPVGRVEV